MQQLSFSYQTDEKSFHSILARLSGKDIDLVITDNSTSMMSMKKRGRIVALRVHNIFLDAGEDVLFEMAAFIKDSRRKTPQVRQFIKENMHRLKKRPPRKVTIKTSGECYDLLDIYSDINEEYFNSSVTAPITWGCRGPRRAAARRTLGSYCGSRNLIRINPILDNRKVPRYFVEYIVYHEMLHAHIGIETSGTRRSIHSARFKKKEKEFRHYDRAIAWERKRW